MFYAAYDLRVFPVTLPLNAMHYEVDYIFQFCGSDDYGRGSGPLGRRSNQSVTSTFRISHNVFLGFIHFQT